MSDVEPPPSSPAGSPRRGLPASFGRYRVIDLVGVGAFASVFRARDDRLDADVAVKVLAENHSFDADLRERFITEGHLLRRIDCPNVVTVFDLGETDRGQPFLVLELAAAGDLGARRRSSTPPAPPIPDVLAVADQLATALGALHHQRVVHRDISPGNLLLHVGSRQTETPAPGRLLVPGERILLSDLGLSKDMAAASGLTVGAGTAGFTPPEQGTAGWVDARADIWSASALVVWLGLGREPDLEGRWRDDLAAIGWRVELVDELDRGLSVEPGDRHETAAEWAASVRHAATTPPVPTAPPTGNRAASGDGSPGTDPARTGAVQPAQGPPRRPSSRRRRLATVGIAVLVAAALLLGGWALGRRTAGDDTTTTTLDDGRVQVTTVEGDVQVSSTGPASVAVGQDATFTAEVTGAAHFVWLAPDGQPYADEARLTVTPSSAGRTTVVLLGLGPNGEIVRAEQSLDVSGES